MSAVEYCHSRNIVHRGKFISVFSWVFKLLTLEPPLVLIDIKHKNILLDEHGRIKLIDFGLSNYFTESSEAQSFCGTPAYASPEMILGQSYRGPEVDVWSCGVVLYTMLTNSFPFASLEKILKGAFDPVKNVSNECAELLSGMLCVDSKKRWSTKRVRRHPWCSGNWKRPEPQRRGSAEHLGNNVFNVSAES
jgi:serine/threonine protein kinase